MKKSVQEFFIYIKDLLTECEVCTGKYCLRFIVQTERRRSEVCAIKTEGNTFPYRPTNEVNKGFIIWLCWIAVCSGLCRKKQKTLSLLQLSAIYTGGFWQCTCCNNKTITILQRKEFNLRKYNVNLLINNKRSMQNEAIKVSNCCKNNVCNIFRTVVLFGVVFTLKRSIWVICFSMTVKLTRGMFFVVTARHNNA